MSRTNVEYYCNNIYRHRPKRKTKSSRNGIGKNIERAAHHTSAHFAVVCRTQYIRSGPTDAVHAEQTDRARTTAYIIYRGKTRTCTTFAHILVIYFICVFTTYIIYYYCVYARKVHGFFCFYRPWQQQSTGQLHPAGNAHTYAQDKTTTIFPSRLPTFRHLPRTTRPGQASQRRGPIAVVAARELAARFYSIPMMRRRHKTVHTHTRRAHGTSSAGSTMGLCTMNQFFPRCALYAPVSAPPILCTLQV